jgi:hypothetical protein
VHLHPQANQLAKITHSRFVKEKRIRLVALFMGFMMHMGIAILMKDLIYFSFQMVCSYVFFLPESWVVYPFEKIKEKLPFL